jgi:hypothetical protein
MASQYDQNFNSKKTLSTVNASTGNNYEYRIGGRSEDWKKYSIFELFSFKGSVCLKILPIYSQLPILAVIKSYSDSEDIKSIRSYSNRTVLNVPGNAYKRPGRIDFDASEKAYNFLEQWGEIDWNDINDIKTYSISIGKNRDVDGKKLYKQILDALKEKAIPKSKTKGGKRKNTKKRSLKKKKTSLKAMRLKRSKKRHTRKKQRNI